jgi:hypothetical protein
MGTEERTPPLKPSSRRSILELGGEWEGGLELCRVMRRVVVAGANAPCSKLKIKRGSTATNGPRSGRAGRTEKKSHSGGTDRSRAETSGPNEAATVCCVPGCR